MYTKKRDLHILDPRLLKIRIATDLMGSEAAKMHSRYTMTLRTWKDKLCIPSTKHALSAASYASAQK